MAIFTDSPDFAAEILPESPASRWDPSVDGGDMDRLLRAFLREPAQTLGPTTVGRPWSHVLVSETADRSNYDRLIELVREGVPLPDRLLCLAGSGQGFHGSKGRPWSAVPGNIHLSLHLAPRRPVPRFEVAFMALAAVSVVDAVDRVPGLEGCAGIRWVNDVVLDGAKVAGVLAYTHAQRTTVNAAVLGIGVNVQTRPPVEPTPFVPAVTSLQEHAPADATLLPSFFRDLLDALDRNYATLLADGHETLIERYRARSVVVGREVTVCAENSDVEPRILSRGVVDSVGDGLELHLAGRAEPVTRGRIIIGGGPLDTEDPLAGHGRAV